MPRRVDLSYALTWMVGTSALFGVFASIPQWRLGSRSWLYKNLLLLIVVGIGIYVDWQAIGYFATLLWATLVILPGHANRRIADAVHRRQLAQAMRWAKLAGVVHPFDGQREQTRFLASQYYFETGQLAEAKGVLYPLLSATSWTERVKLELLRLDERWIEIAEHAKAQAVGQRDLRVAPLYLLALGETGDLHSMWQMYAEVPAPIANQAALRLLVASYSGLIEEVDALLTQHFSLQPSHYSVLTRATTLLSAGRTIEGKRLLAALAQSRAAGSVQARSRLAHPPPTVDLSALPTHLQLLLANFRRTIKQETAVGRSLSRPSRTWATPALGVVLVAMFLIGLPGGSTDPENLVRLGALVLPSELAEGGIAWRIVAAGFLHLGTTHLLMNCLGLWVLGKQIEQLFGGLAMLGLFLASSIGSFGFAAVWVTATASDPKVFLGASSGVLGLVGTLGTYLATGYLLHRREALGRRFMLVVAVVAAQLVFDAFTPVVSSMLHLTGLAIGALSAIPLSVRTWRGISRR